jgi:tetratricopeptide (TPR) repeat protein
LLAFLRGFQLRFYTTDQPYSVSRAKVAAAAESALTIDPGLGRPYQSLAYLEPFGHYLEREALHQKALSAAPNDPEVLALAGAFYGEIGRFHEAVDYAKRAFDLDPNDISAVTIYAGLLDSVGRHAESGTQWKRSCDLWPTSLRVLDAASRTGLRASRAAMRGSADSG